MDGMSGAVLDPTPGWRENKTDEKGRCDEVCEGCSQLDWLHGCEMGAGAADKKSPSESHTSVHEKGGKNEIFAW